MKFNIPEKAVFIGIAVNVIYNDFSSFEIFVKKDFLEEIEDIVKKECLKHRNSDSNYFANLEAVFVVEGANESIVNKDGSLKRGYPFMRYGLKEKIIIETPKENIPDKILLYEEINEYVHDLIDVNGFVNSGCVDKMIDLLNQMKKKG